jgi:beta-lactamase regulating signal transducer with metallopeptidase domain/WD40 repeat protein
MNELLWWFGQNTLAALLMIPCVMLACRLFRDRPAVQHLLWLVILLKFVTPPIVVWPWSVDELRHMAWPQVSDQQRASLEPSPAAPRPGGIEPRLVPIETTMVPNEPAPMLGPSSLPADVLVVTDQADEKTQPTTPTNWSRNVATTAILAWFIGAIVCSVNQLRRLIRYARLVRSGEAAPSHLKAEVASVASRLRMQAPFSVVVKGIVSPFLWCVGNTKLAWPDSLSSQTDVVRSRGIIAHELAHLRRRDHWITWLELGASILWWWNPLFWFVRRQLRETAEMSCDALAIAANPESRREYAELLLRLSSQSTNGVPTPVLAVGAGNVASFERRLKMILSSNVSGNLSWPGSLALTVLAVFALPYWSLAQSAPREPTPPPSAQSNALKESPKEAEPEPMKTPQRYPDHGILTDVRFVNDDKEVVTVSIEGGVNVRRWNVASKQLLSEIKLASDEHGRDVRQGTLQLSADGQKVVAATTDYVGIWDAVSGDLQQKFAIPKKEWEYDCVLCLDISRDGSRIVASLGKTSTSGLVWSGHAIVWDVPLGKEVSRVTYPNNFHFVDLDFSSDGKLFATCNELSARVCIWEADSGKLLLENLQGDDWQSPDPDVIKNNLIYDVAFSQDDSLLAMSGTFGIRLVEVKSGKRLRQIDAPYSYSRTTGLEFSPDGKRLARNGAGVKGIESSYAVPIFDTESGQMLFALKTEADAIRFSANSKLLAVAGSDRAGALSIWPVTGDVITSLPVATVPSSQLHRIDSVEAWYMHYRGKVAEEFANRFGPKWGEAQNGIQYGVALTTGSNQFRVGERVLMAAFVRNVSDKPQHIDLRPDMFWNVPQVVHSDGTPVKIEKRALLGNASHYRDTLEPGEFFGPLYLNVGLGDNPRPQLQNWSPWIAAPNIGKYQLTHSIPLQVADSNSPRDGKETVWTTAKLVSGTIEFEVSDRVAESGRSNSFVVAGQQAAPSQNTNGTSNSSGTNSLPEGLEEHLDWSEPVGGLKAAVMIRSVEALGILGKERRIFLVVQNVSNQAVRFCDTDIHETDVPAADVEGRKLYLKRNGEIMFAL